LFIGMVTMPATLPSSASLVAINTYSRAAAPAPASISPGRWSVAPSIAASITCSGPACHSPGAPSTSMSTSIPNSSAPWRRIAASP
jgi:predicted CxxxxCH...CXXCH cytochrome family protein